MIYYEMIYNELPFNIDSLHYNRFYDLKAMKLIRSHKLEFGLTRENNELSYFSKYFLKKCLKID